jgi:hypothetical protein
MPIRDAGMELTIRFAAIARSLNSFHGDSRGDGMGTKLTPTDPL